MIAYVDWRGNEAPAPLAPEKWRELVNAKIRKHYPFHIAVAEKIKGAGRTLQPSAEYEDLHLQN
jgi:hypothetical protein